VVCELDAGLNVPPGINPDSGVLDDRFAVRVARMIDQARVVAAAVSIDTSLLVEREEISVVAPHALVIVPAICFLVADSFSGILDDLLARSYAPFRKNT